MKNIKALYIALIALVAGVLGACTNDYEPGPAASGPQVSFAASNSATAEFSGAAADNDECVLTLNRVQTNGELDVYFLVEFGDSKYSHLFNVPELVTFNDGEDTAQMTIKVTHTKFSADEQYVVKLLIADEEQTTPYGYSEWTLTCTLNPWQLMQDAKGNNAKGKFRGLDLLSGLYDFDPTVEVDVNVYEHKFSKGLYKVENPWYLSAVAGGMVEEKDFKATQGVDFIIDCTKPDCVWFELQSVGYEFGYGDMLVCALYWYDQNYAGGKYGFAPGTLVDGVITFGVKETGGMEPGYSQSLYNCNLSGMFRIILPGYEAVDYSLAAKYEGMDVAADNKTVSAKLSIAYGNDVTGIQYIVVAGDVENNPTEALTTLFTGLNADGSDATINEVEDFVKGGKQVNLKLALESAGIYSLVAAPQDKNGALNAKEAIVYPFYFAGIGAPEEHPCEVGCMMAAPSTVLPEEYQSYYPDYSSLAYLVYGTDLKYCKFLITTKATVDKYAAQGVTFEQLTEAYGEDLKDYLADVNGEGFSYFAEDLSGETTYAMCVIGTNTYGESASASCYHTTAPVPYSGELVVGDYYMKDVFVDTEDGNKEYVSENVFTVEPIAGQDNMFTVSTFAIEDNLKWYAEYSSEAKTLTMSGLSVGNEDYGALFGNAYGVFDQAGNYYYGIFSYASNESKGKDPIVLTVDPETKQINGLNPESMVEVYIIKAADMSLYGAYNSFVGATTIIEPYTGQDQANATQSVKSSVIKTPFSSISINKELVGNKSNVNIAKAGKSNVSASIKKPISIVDAKFVGTYTRDNAKIERVKGGEAVGKIR